MLPLPMTAIVMPASNQGDAGLIPVRCRSGRVAPGMAAYVTLRNHLRPSATRALPPIWTALPK
jgi:hypothetical protein